MYILNLDGFIIQNKELSELTKIVSYNACPYEIYMVLPSKMNAPGFSPDKLGDDKIKRIREQHDRGYATSTLSRKYGVSESSIRRAIKKSYQSVNIEVKTEEQ